MRKLILIFTALGLAACANAPSSNSGDVTTSASNGDGGLRIGGGYRGADDPCRRVGSSEFTTSFVSSETDLVACPIGFDGRAAFIVATNASEVTRTGEWVLYSVPLIGEAPVSEIPPTPAITGG